MQEQHYRITLTALCLYGFFKELRPSEPYLTDYLIGTQYKNLTQEDVYNKVYPVWPYAYFSLLIPVFLLTDFLRYKPVIILEGLAYIVTWILLLWAPGVLAMQFMEIAYGIATSTEIAYLTYIYAKVPSEKYQTVTSLARSAILFGRFSSGLCSQLLSSLDILDYGQLNYVSLVSVSTAFFICLFLPKVTTSIYFHGGQNHRDEEGEDEANQSTTEMVMRKSVARRLIQDAKTAYTKPAIIKWSVWTALATCGNFQIGNYIQTLWHAIPNDSEDYNGAVEAATTLTGSLVVFILGYVTIDWTKWGNLAIVIMTGLTSLLLYLMGITTQIWMAYAGYYFVRMSYQALMTVAYFEIVKELPKDSYGLIFGFNTFVALGIQTILTLVVNTILGIEAQPQFKIYAGFYLAICVFYLPLLVRCRRRQST